MPCVYELLATPRELCAGDEGATPSGGLWEARGRPLRFLLVPGVLGGSALEEI